MIRRQFLPPKPKNHPYSAICKPANEHASARPCPFASCYRPLPSSALSVPMRDHKSRSRTFLIRASCSERMDLLM